MKIELLKRSNRNFNIFLLLIFFTYSIVSKNNIIKTAVSSGINICLTTIIPSVFPMLILSTLFLHIKCPDFILKIADKILYPLFGLSGNSLIPLLAALTQGYPIASKCAYNSYQKGLIRKNEAEILAIFFTCPGLSSAISLAGNTYFGSSTIGLFFLLSCIFSEIFICIIFNLKKKKKDKYERNAIYDNKITFTSEIFVESVSGASKSIIDICSWILCFSVITSVFNSYIHSQIFTTTIQLFSEITDALAFTSKIGNMELCAACMCFGSLSVACQISPELKKLDISFVYYLLIRSLCAFTAFYIERIFIYLFPKAIETSSGFYTFKPFNHSVTGSFSLIILCIVFLISLTSENKQKNNLFSNI